jgi:hypothetical protein
VTATTETTPVAALVGVDVAGLAVVGGPGPVVAPGVTGSVVWPGVTPDVAGCPVTWVGVGVAISDDEHPARTMVSAAPSAPATPARTVIATPEFDEPDLRVVHRPGARIR